MPQQKRFATNAQRQAAYRQRSLTPAQRRALGDVAAGVKASKIDNRCLAALERKGWVYCGGYNGGEWEYKLSSLPLPKRGSATKE